MNIPELSPSLKHIRKFLVQAKQLERVDIVMAYLCRMHAVTEGFKVKERTKTDTMYLIALMDWLENNQIAVAGMSQEERQARAESFALSVFQTGDDVDRAGEADESTAKCFLTAHVLFEVCTMFGPLKPELQQKMKYAAWKAVEIRKALREGRRPVPGDALDMAAANALENDQGEQVPTESLPHLPCVVCARQAALRANNQARTYNIQQAPIATPPNSDRQTARASRAEG